jgi:acid stress-induced BolA-like protein IbaG/YrbA
MDIQVLRARILQLLPDASVEISGEGCNLACTVISDKFDGESLLNRQKTILSLVNDEIKSGELHALTIKARTPQEV